MNLFGSNRVFFFNLSFIFCSEISFLQSSFRKWTILIKVFNERENLSGYVTINNCFNWCVLSRLIVHKYHQNQKILITFKTSLHCLTKRNKTHNDAKKNKLLPQKTKKKLSLFHSSLSFAASFGISSLLFVVHTLSFFLFCNTKNY